MAGEFEGETISKAMMRDCQDCRYLMEERAAIHEFDGKASRADAERMAQGERCTRHQAIEKSTGAEALKIMVKRWEKFGDNAGEFVGGKRTLAGPFRFGFDGSRDVVIDKYRRWLHEEIQAKGMVFGKLRDLLPIARTGAGLVLVCVDPEIGEVIARALKWMSKNEGGEARKDAAA